MNLIISTWKEKALNLWSLLSPPPLWFYYPICPTLTHATEFKDERETVGNYGNDYCSNEVDDARHNFHERLRCFARS